MDSKAYSVCSVKCGIECGMLSVDVKCGVRSVECGGECGVGSGDCGV